MTTDELMGLTIVKAAIVAVAPETEAELSTVDTTTDVFEYLELDSMDHLAVMTEIADRTGRQISEREYPLLRSLDALAAWIDPTGSATGGASQASSSQASSSQASSAG